MKIGHGLLLGIAGILLSSCSPIQDKGIYFDDDQFIVSEGDSYSYHSCRGSLSDMAILDFSGTETIFVYNLEATITTIVEYKIAKGRFKVVLINPENEITELNGKQTIYLEGGSYRIKIVGDHAYGNVSIDLRT